MRSHVVVLVALAALFVSAPGAWAQAFVTADSVTQSSGNGSEHAFVLHYSDSAGAADLGAWVWFHDPTAAATAPSCLIAYTAATNTVNLLDDTATVWSHGIVGTLTLLQNSQCEVALVISNAALDGPNLVLTLWVAFKPAWTGVRTVDMYAASSAGRTNSGWGRRGSWNVSCLTHPPVPAWRLLPAAGGDTGTAVSFTGCQWTFSGVPPWIAAREVENGGVTGLRITVDANPTAVSRRALLTVADQPFWVIQRGTAPSVRGDLDGDGNVDLLWQSPTGYLGVWLMNGASVDLPFSNVDILPSSSSVVGAVDFDGDGLVDLLTQRTTGELLETSEFRVANAVPLLTQPTDWKVVATADIDHDGGPDILWQSPSGAVGAWLMRGTNVVGTRSIYSGASIRHVMAADDFDGDGNPDLVWQSPTGAVVVWHLDASGRLLSATSVFTGTTDWKVVSTGDLDHDGFPDLIWQTPDGTVAVSYMQNTVIRSTQTIFAGPTAWRVIGPK